VFSPYLFVSWRLLNLLGFNLRSSHPISFQDWGVDVRVSNCVCILYKIIKLATLSFALMSMPYKRPSTRGFHVARRVEGFRVVLHPMSPPYCGRCAPGAPHPQTQSFPCGADSWRFRRGAELRVSNLMRDATPHISTLVRGRWASWMRPSILLPNNKVRGFIWLCLYSNETVYVQQYYVQS